MRPDNPFHVRKERHFSGRHSRRLVRPAPTAKGEVSTNIDIYGKPAGVTLRFGELDEDDT